MARRGSKYHDGVCGLNPRDPDGARSLALDMRARHEWTHLLTGPALTRTAADRESPLRRLSRVPVPKLRQDLPPYAASQSEFAAFVCAVDDVRMVLGAAAIRGVSNGPSSCHAVKITDLHVSV